MYNITMILAMDKNNLVGKTNGRFGLAWHYPEDLKFYKENTVNKINIMGRNTYEVIGQALPNRETYILTRNSNFQTSDAKIITCTDEVLAMSQTNEIMICGGVSVYQCFNKFANKIILSKINNEHDGDIYYNDLDLSAFKMTNVQTNGSIEFQTWERDEN